MKLPLSLQLAVPHVNQLRKRGLQLDDNDNDDNLLKIRTWKASAESHHAALKIQSLYRGHVYINDNKYM